METQLFSDWQDGISVFSISVGSNSWFMGAPVEITRSYFPHHKHKKSSWPGLLTPCCTTSLCQLGTEGCPGLGISPSNSPITYLGWGADPSTLPEKIFYYMQSLCRGAKPWESLDVAKKLAFPRKIKVSPHWEETQQFCQQKGPLLKAQLSLSRGYHPCPCRLHLSLKPSD